MKFTDLKGLRAKVSIGGSYTLDMRIDEIRVAPQEMVSPSQDYQSYIAPSTFYTMTCRADHNGFIDSKIEPPPRSLEHQLAFAVLEDDEAAAQALVDRLLEKWNR